jgi:hypothetical protein
MERRERGHLSTYYLVDILTRELKVHHFDEGYPVLPRQTHQEKRCETLEVLCNR